MYLLRSAGDLSLVPFFSAMQGFYEGEQYINVCPNVIKEL
jgi:hypothetical protein